MKGCTSPRDPQICIAMFSRGAPILLVLSLMNSSTRVVLPLRGFAHPGGRHAAESFWSLSNQYFRCVVFLWNCIATWPKVLTLPVLCAFPSWYSPRFCLELKLRGIAIPAARGSYIGLPMDYRMIRRMTGINMLQLLVLVRVISLSRLPLAHAYTSYLIGSQSAGRGSSAAKRAKHGALPMPRRRSSAPNELSHEQIVLGRVYLDSLDRNLRTLRCGAMIVRVVTPITVGPRAAYIGVTVSTPE